MVATAHTARHATPSGPPGGVASSPARRAFGLGVVLATLLLVFMGAQVKSHDAGLATHSWPLAWGEVWPEEVGAPRLWGGLDITHEHWHRAVGAAVGLLAVVLALWTRRSDRRPLVRRLAWALLGLIVLQGLLGALTVRTNLPPLVSASHGTLAQTILCVAAWVAWLNTREGAGLAPGAQVDAPRVAGARRAAALALAAVFVQLLLGAWMRHREAGLAVPFFPADAAGNLLPARVDELVVLHMLHRGFAFVAVGAVFVAVLRAGAAVPALMGHGAWLAGLVVAQGTLGAAVVWSARQPFVTSLHVANGAAVLVLAWLLVLRLGRLSGRVPAPRATHHGLVAHAAADPAPPEPGAPEPGAPAHAATPADATPSRRRAPLDGAALAGLLRPRIATLVLLTTWAGYALERPADWSALPAALLGTLLTAAAGCALNHYLERDTDALMERTRRRPLVTGALRPGEVLAGGVLAALVGLAVLAWGATPLAAAVQAAALLVYLLVYTPLKRRTSTNTWVGALPGALPLITGAAAAGGPGTLAWAGFLLIFLWQLPHFFAIASMYRDQYAEGGLRMLSGEDPDDHLLRWQMPMQVMSVMLVSLLPVTLGAAHGLYLATAVAVGLLFLGAALRFRRRPDRRGARRVVLASVIYLPIVLAALVLDVACVQPADAPRARSVDAGVDAAGADAAHASSAGVADAADAADGVPCAHCAAGEAVPADASLPDPAAVAPGAGAGAALPWAERPSAEQEAWFLPAVGPSGLPVYGRLPEFELLTEAREPFTRESFAGGTWVVGFIYARCGGVCADMTRAFQLLHAEQLPAHVLSVTIDPSNDTPEMLAAYRAEWEGSADWWTLLTGPREEIQRMADEGFRLPVNTLYTETEGLPKMFHSERLALVDDEGRVRGYYAPQDAEDRARLHRDAAALTRLLAD